MVDDDKTVFMHFSPHINVINECNLHKNGCSYSKQVQELKFLGLTLNSSLNWEPHINVNNILFWVIPRNFSSFGKVGIIGKLEILLYVKPVSILLKLTGFIINIQPDLGTT